MIFEAPIFVEKQWKYFLSENASSFWFQVFIEMYAKDFEII